MFTRHPYNPEGDELSGRTVIIIAITIVLALAVAFYVKRGGNREMPPATQDQQGEVR